LILSLPARHTRHGHAPSFEEAETHSKRTDSI
jgi:hypothetical protein